jgi:hypothetical protein
MRTLIFLIAIGCAAQTRVDNTRLPDGPLFSDAGPAGSTLSSLCATAGSGTLSIAKKWNALATQSVGCLLAFNGGVIQPASGQKVTFTVQSAPLSAICDISQGGTCIIFGPNGQVVPQWWGAVSDSVTDNTAPIQASVTAAIAGHQTWFLPPVGGADSSRACYMTSSPIVVNGGLTMQSVALAQGTTSSGTAVLCTVSPDRDILQIHGTGGGLTVRNLSFEHLAGYAVGISAASPNTITLIKPSNVALATLTAPPLRPGTTVYRWRTYTNAGNLYRVTDAGARGTARIPLSGGVLPTHASGTLVQNGISWMYEGRGTTYQQGQIAAGAQWWFHGYSGGVLTDVTPSDSSSNATPNDFDGKGHSVVGIVPYFVSLVFQGNTGSNTASYIHVFTGSTFTLAGNYCLFSPGSCILLENAAFNGLISDNVMDSGYIGISGNLNQALITNNEFFGLAGKAIDSSAGQFFTISNNQVIAGAGFSFSTSYVPGSSADSPVSSGNITGNAFANATYAANMNGVTAIGFSGNLLTRGEQAPVLTLSNIDRSRFSNGFHGAGEGSNSAGTSYIKFSGVVRNNEFCGSTFQQVNSAETVTTIYDWSAAPTQEGLNTFCPDNVYGSSYTITTGSADKELAPVNNGTTGTFTPVLEFGGSGTGIKYAAGGQTGSYVVNGNQVTVRLVIALSSKGKASGTATITGLPFAASSLIPSGARFGGSFATLNGMGSIGTPLVGLQTGHTYLDLYKFNGSNSAAMADTDFTDSSEMEIGITYSQR